ncbi:MAG TPA: ATP-binding cassette domain-containing protein [Rhodopila sp.]|nr:ATP-binding cassette domain-containing protein [Rhodopila sp.]
MLDVRIRSKTFRPPRGAERPILRDVGFSAQAGEILVLLGPSGIGKSTILRIALGLDQDFDGTVKRSDGRIGVMFQEPRLLPWLSVEDNLHLVQPPDMAPPDVAALLEEVLLPPVRTLMPSALSLGMARRVALARAFAVDPEMLVLDEPFASLDAGLAGALGMRIAARVRQRGTLALLSTHDAGQALTMASRILVVAGHPATLLADVPVPDHRDSAAIGRLHQDLLGRFAFLARTDPTNSSSNSEE